MELHEKIKTLRLSQGLTQKELGAYLSVSTVSIRNWENGTKCPSMSAIISLAKIFKISTDSLLGVTTEQAKDVIPLTHSELTLLDNYRMLDKHGRKIVDTLCAMEKSRVETERTQKATQMPNIISVQKQPCRYIPRYTTPSAAGYSAPLDGDDFEMILVDENVPTEADFAVGIQGNSMYPYIHDGDTVYVKKDCELSIGDVGIFCVDGAMYCKQYYIDEERNLILVSANPRLRNTNVFISSDSGSSVKCYGKVLLERQIELPNYIFE